MKNKLEISLIIPCRNEAEGIASMVKKALKVANEVIVVDNRSTDDTALVAKKAGARVIKESRVDKFGIGYGYSLIKGMKVAKCENIVTLDGDGTYPLDQVRDAVKHLKKEKADMVLCSRFPLVDGQAISWWRQLGVWLLNTQVRIIYKFAMQDVLSGMWVVKKTALNSLKLKEGGWNLSPEIKLAAIASEALRISQFHIHHYEREFGQSKQKLLLTGLEHLLFIFTYKVKAFWLSLSDSISTLVKTSKSIGEVRV